MTLERWFRRKRPTKGDDDSSPIGLWLKCESCNSQIYRKDLVANAYICPECEHHYQMPVEARINLLLDENSFEQWSGGVTASDPLEFHDQKPYPERLKLAQEKQGRRDAILTGSGLIEGENVAISVMDFFFMGGSMGSVVGEEIARAAERAAAENRAFVSVTASGGARMQEGALSLMQMAKTTVAIEKLSEKQLPFISILTDPTTGGTTASFATLGDIIIAEPKALICFAGPRVIQQTIKQELPEGFQRSEFLLEHGMLDDVLPRQSLKAKVASYIRLLRSSVKESVGEVNHALSL
jgi:acetyl-CoA carboxylase carboxyl transferase subunit beta